MSASSLKLNLSDLERAGTDPALLDQLRALDTGKPDEILYEELKNHQLIFANGDTVTIATPDDFRALLERFNKSPSNAPYARFADNTQTYIKDAKLPENTPAKVSANSPDNLTRPRIMDYDAIDAAIRSQTNLTFYDYCNQPPGVLNGVVKDAEDFKTHFSDYVTRLYFGDSSPGLLLYNAYAEEGHFTKLPDGSLAMGKFSGMNVPHAAALDMLNDLFEGVAFDAAGDPHGTGILNVDTGYMENSVPIAIDFDNHTIDPPLKITEFGRQTEVSFADIMAFIEIYTAPGPDGKTLFLRTPNGFVLNESAAKADAMTVFVISGSLKKTPEGLGFIPDPTILRHEIHHALYDGNPHYRDKVQTRARAATPEQRECAVLYLCGLYDIFDPDAAKVTRDIVVDEAFNAYTNQGAYDPQTGMSSAVTAAIIMQATGLELSLSSFMSIEDLPLSENEKTSIRREYEAFQNRSGNLSEQEFLATQSPLVFAHVRDMNLLRGLIREQAPDFYQRIIKARMELVDWVDGD